MTRSEWLRKLAHIAAFSPALLLPWLTPMQAISLTVGVFLVNAFVLPKAAPWVYRREEPGRGALEIILYPAAVLACLAAFSVAASPIGPEKPPWYLAPAAAWFLLAFLDGFIGLFCRVFPGGPALPWNSRKPVLGFCLGTAAAGLAAFGTAWWILPAMGFAGWISLTVLILGCALVETFWFGIADNLTVPLAFCAMLPLLPSVFFPQASWAVSPWLAIGLPLGFGFAAYAAKQLTLGGACLGAALAMVLMAAEPRLFAFVGGFFILGVAATRFGSEKKRALGIAEARDGRRGAAEVFGSLAVTAWMTPLVHLTRNGFVTGETKPALLVCAAPLIAKAMDTVASEMGKALGGKTVLPLTWRSAPPGAAGAVSLAGTVWGLAAAGLLSLLILPLGWGGIADVVWLAAIAAAANLFESYWGGWASRRGINHRPHTNFLLTLFAALAAWVLWS